MSKISELTKEKWIMSTFPEWGTWLNEDIEHEEVKPGTVAMWWLGCTGIWMKTPGANISIDMWCGNGKRTHGDDKMKVGHQMANMCGARRMQPNLRAVPFVMDPFGFHAVDAVLATHYHQDHMSVEWAAQVINSGMTTTDDVLEEAASKSGIDYYDDDEPEPEDADDDSVFEQEPQLRIDFFGKLAIVLGIASVFDKRQKAHIRHCNGDCAHCPPHYGYRYGRWYYGHHHQQGCEFGGNR